LDATPQTVTATDRTAVRVPGDLVERFVAQVLRAPQADAVRANDVTLSYAVLNERANRVAHRLLALLPSGTPETFAPRIGMLCAHEAPMVAGLLGILKAGCAWVPLDPAWPAARLAAIACDAGLGALVTDQAHLAQARALPDLPLVDVDDPCDDGTAIDNPAVKIGPDTLAYIIYTSGSTGTPKGVMQTHGGVLTQVGRYSEALHLQPGDRLSGLSGYAYDAAIQDIFGALLNGATVCPLAVRGGGRLAERSRILERLTIDAVTILHATPSLFRYLFTDGYAGDLSSVRTVVLGGEAVRRMDFELYRSSFARGTQFVNGLGLTESTVALQFAADHDTRLLGQRVPVGTPVAGLAVELIDGSGAPGWRGEIVLTGPGLSPGYWPAHNPPGSGSPCVSRLRTGDRGYRLPDGRIVYAGRCDGQVNIRGYRVEPGEIEATLNGLPGVADSAVRAWDRDDEAWLAAYLVAEPGVEPCVDGLRRALAERLPAYMLPQTFEWLTALPRLANGKTARDRLPAPRPGQTSDPAPARTELETALLSIWSELLPVDTPGVHDDFFMLGGHSLLATRVVARIRDRLGIEIPLAGIFDAATVAGLAARIESGFPGDSAPALQHIPRQGRRRS